MEDIILRLMENTKISFDTAALINVGLIFLLTIAALIVLTVVHKKIKKRLAAKHDIRKTYTSRIVFRVLRALVALAGLIAMLQAIGINMTWLSTGFAVLVILLALTVKDALQDIFAGIVILSDKYFNVGDAVEFEGKEGIVTSFTARTTKIEYLEDHSVLSVANRNISKIRKLTHLVDVDLPLPYEVSRREAFNVLNGICEKIGRLEGVESCELKGTQNFDASATVYKIRFFCEPHDRLDIRRSVLRTIQDGLEVADIHIPYQQIDIHSK